VASRKKHRPSGQQLDLTVTRVPADDERLRAIVKALAEVGLAFLHAREKAATPLRSPGPDDGKGAG
jgi:hypothetical protein